MLYMYIVMCCFFIFRVGVEGCDVVIDVFIKVIFKNKLVVEFFVKVGGIFICRCLKNFY